MKLLSKFFLQCMSLNPWNLSVNFQSLLLIYAGQIRKVLRENNCQTHVTWQLLGWQEH
jgi:hypothetical protein